LREAVQAADARLIGSTPKVEADVMSPHQHT
jgi:hypothetical protein